MRAWARGSLVDVGHGGSPAGVGSPGTGRDGSGSLAADRPAVVRRKRGSGARRISRHVRARPVPKFGNRSTVWSVVSATVNGPSKSSGFVRAHHRAVNIPRHGTKETTPCNSNTPVPDTDSTTAWMARATAATIRRRCSSPAMASASTVPARSATGLPGATMPRVRTRATASSTASGAAAASVSVAASSSVAASTSPPAEPPPRAASGPRDPQPVTRERETTPVPRGIRRRCVDRLLRRRAQAVVGLAVSACGGLSAASFWPSARPSLNSFCALPRFLASFGSCEPPKSTRTTRRMMPISGGSKKLRAWDRLASRRCAGTPGRWEVGPNGSGAGAAGGLGTLAAQATTLALGQPAPDAELLAVHQRVLEAVDAHDTATADFLGLTGGRATLGEEEVGVDARQFAWSCQFPWARM